MSLSFNKNIVLFLRKIAYLHEIKQNEKHPFIFNIRIWKESVEIYQRWEKYECKMADFQNHRCFSLRCLSKDVIPTRVRLKSNIKTPKGKYIIRKVERALLNERIRSINNSITMFELLRDTFINQLESILEKETMEKCGDFIENRRERRLLSTLD